MIRFYLGEEPLLPERADLALRRAGRARATCSSICRELVVKETRGSGGYGMLIGPRGHARGARRLRARSLRARPTTTSRSRRSRSRPARPSSTAGIAPRHVDLRPFVLQGREIRIVPGGLTRVALREGSLVVNSSQGGGTKDTWVLEG